MHKMNPSFFNFSFGLGVLLVLLVASLVAQVDCKVKVVDPLVRVKSCRCPRISSLAFVCPLPPLVPFPSKRLPSQGPQKGSLPPRRQVLTPNQHKDPGPCPYEGNDTTPLEDQHFEEGTALLKIKKNLVSNRTNSYEQVHTTETLFLWLTGLLELFVVLSIKKVRTLAIKVSPKAEVSAEDISSVSTAPAVISQPISDTPLISSPKGSSLVDSCPLLETPLGSSLTDSSESCHDTDTDTDNSDQASDDSDQEAEQECTSIGTLKEHYPSAPPIQQPKGDPKEYEEIHQDTPSPSPSTTPTATATATKPAFSKYDLYFKKYALAKRRDPTKTALKGKVEDDSEGERGIPKHYMPYLTTPVVHKFLDILGNKKGQTKEKEGEYKRKGWGTIEEFTDVMRGAGWLVNQKETGKGVQRSKHGSSTVSFQLPAPIKPIKASNLSKSLGNDNGREHTVVIQFHNDHYKYRGAPIREITRHFIIRALEGAGLTEENLSRLL